LADAAQDVARSNRAAGETMNEQYRRILDAWNIDEQFEIAHERALLTNGREKLAETTLAYLWVEVEKQFGPTPKEVVFMLAANVSSRREELDGIISRVRDRYLGV
jgi:hypothetical protein